jgi:hypothetical protein
MAEDSWIASSLLQIREGLFGPVGLGSNISSQLDQILAAVELNQRTQRKILADFEALQNEFQTLQNQVQQIIAFLTPPPPVAFLLTISAGTPEGEALNRERLKSQGEYFMAGNVTRAALDFQLLDNGTALATATPIDAAGLPTTLPAGSGTPVWASSAPSVVVTPVATDPTGLSATVTPSTPPVLATAVQVSVTAALASGSSITGTDLVDVVAGGPTGFSVAMN